MLVYSSLATLCLLLFSGCIAIPKKAPLREGDRVLTDEIMDFLVAPETNRAAVIEAMGAPLVKSKDGTRLLYLFVWRSSSTEVHIFDPVSGPAMAYGAAMGVPPSFDKVSVHGSQSMDWINKQILLIEFDNTGAIVRHAAYEFPRHIIPSQIVEDWKIEPLPDYFIPIH